MIKYLLWLALACLHATCWAQDDPQARTIHARFLEKMKLREAIERADYVFFECTITAEVNNTKNVMMSTQVIHPSKRLLYQETLSVMEQTKPLLTTNIQNGQQGWFKSAGDEKIHTFDEQTMKKLEGTYALLSNYLYPEDKFELKYKEEKIVDGKNCHVISCYDKTTQVVSDNYYAVEDGLVWRTECSANGYMMVTDVLRYVVFDGLLFPETLVTNLEINGVKATTTIEYKTISLNYPASNIRFTKEALEQKDDAIELYRSAFKNELAGNYKLALDYYEKTIQVKPNYVAAHAGRIRSLEKLADYHKQIEACQILIGIVPSRIETHLHKAIANVQIKNYEAAKLDCLNVLQIDENNAMAFDMIALINYLLVSDDATNRELILQYKYEDKGLAQFNSIKAKYEVEHRKQKFSLFMDIFVQALEIASQTISSIQDQNERNSTFVTENTANNTSSASGNCSYMSSKYNEAVSEVRRLLKSYGKADGSQVTVNTMSWPTVRKWQDLMRKWRRECPEIRESLMESVQSVEQFVSNYNQY